MLRQYFTGRRPRVWLFRLLAAIGAPVALLVACEGLLRLFSFGYDPHFFVPVAGRGELTGNAQFGQRFFPAELTQPPMRFIFPAAKSAGTYRIFILGSSAAAGVPDVSYNFGRILQVMLEDAFPARHFEVVNTAMVAINSHGVRQIARECAQYQPDLFVVYTGNNEVVGPYGAGTIFASFGKSLGVIRAGIRLRAMRLGQLLDRIGRGLSSDKDRFTRWRGMEMFLGHQVGPDDPRLRTVYSHFRRNLEDICGIARRSGAQVVLCTVATNLRDSPPFASVHAADYPRAGRPDWDASYPRGTQAQQAGQWKEAAAAFTAALASDACYAEAHFRLAQCLMELGQGEAAREQFVLARDTDALRFRADTAIGQVIREVSRVESVQLVDAEAALARSDRSPHGLPGHELFYEHCHFTFEGNYALAAAVFPSVAARVRDGTTGGETGSVEPLPLVVCAERLAFTGWDRHEAGAKVMAMMTRPPFTNQLGQAARLAARRRSLASLERFLTEDALAVSRGIYERALNRAPGDLLLRLNYVRLLTRLSDFQSAESQWRMLADRLPQDPELQYDLGTALLRVGRIQEAEESFRLALRLRHAYPRAHMNLAVALSARGRLDEAADHCRQAIRCDPEYAEAHCNLAKLLIAQGKRAEGLKHAREAVRLRPGWQEAMRLLTP